MGRIIRQPFKPRGKFVASKTFRFHGKSYAKGDEFPWRTISCSVRKLRTLYEGRLISYAPEEELDALDETIETPEPEIVEPEVDETEEDDEGEEDGDEVDTYDPEIHEIINPERGEWYLADAEGNRLLKLKAKEAKRLRKKQQPEEINPDGIFKE